MEKFTLVKDIIIILLFSLPVIYFFKKLRLSTIAGFLITGMIIGPSGFGIIDNGDGIEVLAELGIILLMFTIGLEFSLDSLARMKKLFFVAGNIQVFGTIAVVAAILSIFGFSIRLGIFAGMLVSLSSTAIVLKILKDKSLLDSLHGRTSAGILIYQDLTIILMLLVLPLLNPKETAEVGTIITKLLFSGLIITATIIASKLLLPQIMYQLSKMRLREVFTAGMAALILGVAFITHSLELSFSIGAFIAGFIISDTDFSQEINAEITPFKDIFNSIFFVSVGMLVNSAFLFENLGITLLALILVLAVKAGIIFIAVRALGYPSRTLLFTSLALCQVGEFSFVLAKSGLEIGLISNEYFNLFLASSIFTMIITPFLIEAANPLSERFRLPSEGSDFTPDTKLKNHVIIVGYGLNGKNLANVLRETGIPYCILEVNPETVRKYKNEEPSIYFGDSTRRDILEGVNISSANVIVFAISDPDATRAGLRLAKTLNKSIYAIVRTRYVNDIKHLLKLGADFVIPEEYETSLQIFARVLEKYHIPVNVILKQLAIFRLGSYEMMRGDTKGIPSYQLNELLAKGLTETFYVDEHCICCNKSLKELDLRIATGATVITIIRGNEVINNPSGDTVLLAGDTLVINGTHQSVSAAVELLNGNSTIN